MLPTDPHTSVCLELTRAITKSGNVRDIYAAALDALAAGLGVERASILLFDLDGVMRFEASRGLSEGYRRAVEGHTPWSPDARDPHPIVVPDVMADPSLVSFWETLEAERIAALVFIPLCSRDRVVGKFMLYYDAPYSPDVADLELAGVIAAHVAFALDRTRAELHARDGEARLRFALESASMGTWDWDLRSNTVQWSENLERLHGLPAGSFDRTFASYEREIHPEDRERVLASIARALSHGEPHDVEYRVVAPDGTVRWCEGKGRVEYDDGVPARMTGVCMMVTRRKEPELARLAAAEDASRLKDEFLSTLSHELRTPLNAILGWLQMLQAGQLPPDRTRQAIDVIERNARLQARLIEDVLDTSRIVTGRFNLDRSLLTLPWLVDGVLADAAPALCAKTITVSRHMAPDLPPVEGDPKRLHQVLSSLVSNAVKFSQKASTIELSCRSDGDWVLVAVRDSGAGIAPEFLPFVFDRFSQADGRTTRRHGGLGLGLALARHLVEQHGGDIWAESAGLGLGTTVHLRLPAALSGRSRVAPAVPGASEADLRFDGLALLVVDDERDSREMMALLLEQRGAEIMLCDSAAGALDVLAGRRVDLVIADIAMPDMDGYDLLRRLRASGNATPAIAVTACAHPDDRGQALEAGYAAHCAKPIDASVLLSTIRGLLSRA